MATIPKIVTYSLTSADVLNAIRNDATQNYQQYVPEASPNAESIKAIGAIIMADPQLQNTFLNSLVNRIARVIVTNKMYTNPLKSFKKGLLEMGETIEEVFVNIAKPFQYDPAGSEGTLFKRETPDVRVAFHIRNYQKFYKATVEEEELRTAFLSMSGITDLITKIVDSMYTGAEYDEFQLMKYMLAKHILKGHMYPVTIPTVNSDNMKAIVAKVKAISNDMTFMKDKYNIAGVKTHTPKNEQYILVNTEFDASMDVEVLASAFNMDKAQFIGNRVLVDSFGSIDNERLAVLMADDTTYVALTDAELLALDAIPAVIVDEGWFMIFDNMYKFTQVYNDEGLYWNYKYHTWKTFSVSPFANNALFIPATPTVTSVAISPLAVTVDTGNDAHFSATVVTENFAPKTVNWSINSELSTIDNSGNLHVGSEETAPTITVTATSTFDNTKSGTATVTVA